jgi:hypothetical protein
MKSSILFPSLVCVAAVGVYACNAKPATPVAPTPAETSAPDGSTLKASAPSAQSPVNDEKIQTAVVVLRAGAATLQYESPTPVNLQYRFQVMGPGGSVVHEQLVNGTTYEVTATLVDDARHTWRVRAEAQGEAGPWSSTASFVTRDPALINDPLTNGQTVGSPIGGTFCPGDPRCPAGVSGWMSTSCTDGLNYDIPTCDDCTMEFDITNIGKGEGVACGNDVKFVSMARAGDFGSFGAFRDSPWKVQLIQRADGAGTELEIVWRNGKASEHGNPGDHRIKMPRGSGGPNFRDTSVFHFVLKWTAGPPGGYHISVGTDGGPQVPYLIDGFGSHPYAPPNHRVQLGCSPRAESFPSAVYRNVRIYRNR